MRCWRPDLARGLALALLRTAAGPGSPAGGSNSLDAGGGGNRTCGFSCKPQRSSVVGYLVTSVRRGCNGLLARAGPGGNDPRRRELEGCGGDAPRIKRTPASAVARSEARESPARERSASVCSTADASFASSPASAAG